ncbi:Down syndrome cell adhesion molecule-like protein Dscam2, partial [Leptotrombidium deliense]
ILSDSGVLNILKSTEKDSGIYECVANNNVDEILRKSVRILQNAALSVRFKVLRLHYSLDMFHLNTVCFSILLGIVNANFEAPKIQPILTGPPLKEGGRFISICSIFEGDGPFYFHWSKNGVPLTTQSSDHKIETSSVISTLSFEKISREDAGNYSCTVNNAYGEDIPLKWIEEPKDIKVTQGESVVVNCSAEGSPQPSIKWMKDEKQVSL